MAEFAIFVDDRDLQRLWHILLIELRLHAWPDPYFGDPPVPRLSTPSQVVQNLTQYPRIAPALSYFLTSPDWIAEELQYRNCADNPNLPPHWYVMQRCGRPSIHFACRIGNPRHTTPGRLISGMFSDYPYYHSTLRASTVLGRPEGLGNTMALLKRLLLTEGAYVASASHRRAIAMAGALEAHRGGIKLLQGDIEFTANKALQRTRQKRRAAEG